jgi:hypothetical protein
VAPFADCSTFRVPPPEQVLCPREPVGRRRRADWYTWSPDSPVHQLQDPRSPVIGEFARRVIVHQPLDYAGQVMSGMLRGFAITRTRRAGEPPITRTWFPLRPVIYIRRPTRQGDPYGRGSLRPELARLLRSYQLHRGYAPGPLLAVAIIAGGLAALGVGRARHSTLRPSAFLFAGLALALLFTSVAVNEFTWRYWIPELVLMPPSGALGATALAGLTVVRGTAEH